MNDPGSPQTKYPVEVPFSSHAKAGTPGNADVAEMFVDAVVPNDQQPPCPYCDGNCGSPRCMSELTGSVDEVAKNTMHDFDNIALKLFTDAGFVAGGEDDQEFIDSIADALRAAHRAGHESARREKQDIRKEESAVRKIMGQE